MSKNNKKKSQNKENSTRQKSKYYCNEEDVVQDLYQQAKLTEFIPKEEINDKQTFIENLNQIIKNLIYISETDSDVFPFAGEELESLDVESFREQIIFDNENDIEEIGFDEFFENLTVIEDWYEDEEKETAENFLKLKNLLEENMKNLKVFKVGKIEVDIYVVGLDEENKLSGIKTKAVET